MSDQTHTEPDAPAATEPGTTDAVSEADAQLTTADLARSGDERSDVDEPEVDKSGEDERNPLFAGEDADQFRERWRDIQSRFVDEPRRAVEEGDALLATLMQRLAETFAQERSKLEGQWDREGDDFSTEDLRVALQRYRSFFDRLLSA